jgi:hypothetical protein
MADAVLLGEPVEQQFYRVDHVELVALDRLKRRDRVAPGSCCEASDRAMGAGRS